MNSATVGELHATGRNNFHLIRLLAALAVIYGHAFPVTGSGDADWYLKLVGNKFIGGVAVDVFFVASGFLIASSLERSSIPRYIWARCLRILPALFVVTALSVFVVGPLITISPTYWTDPQTYHYLINNTLMLKTEYFLPGVFASNPDKAMNGSLWSLPVEFRLYGIFLLLSVLGLLRRNRYSLIVVGLLLAGLALVPRVPSLSAEYANWVNCTALFFAGGLVWKRRDEVVLSIWGVLGVIALCVAFKGGPGFAAAYFVAVIYLVFYMAYAVRLPVIHKRDLSYGVYLYGWPVQQLLVHSNPGMSPMVNTLAASLLATVLAFASWELIERPMLNLKSYVK